MDGKSLAWLPSKYQPHSSAKAGVYDGKDEIFELKRCLGIGIDWCCESRMFLAFWKLVVVNCQRLHV